jgi:hypothetical protein
VFEVRSNTRTRALFPRVRGKAVRLRWAPKNNPGAKEPLGGMGNTAHPLSRYGSVRFVLAGVVSGIGVCLGRRGHFAFLLRFYILLRSGDVFIPAAFLVGERHGVAILVGRIALNSTFGIGSCIRM